LVKALKNNMKKFNFIFTMDFLLTNILWIVLAVLVIFNLRENIYSFFLLVIGLLILLIYQIRQQETNYMQYPYYQWKEINKILNRANTYSKLQNKFFDKNNKMWLKMRDSTEKLEHRTIKFSDFTQEYKDTYKKEIEYDIAQKIMFDFYLHMLQSNTAILNGKKTIDQIIEEYKKGLWTKVLDYDDSFNLIKEAKKIAEKRYDESIEFLKKEYPENPKTKKV